MGAAPQRTQIPRASAAPCTAAQGRPGCRLLKGKALWGSLCVKTVQGSEGDMADPYNGGHSPYLQPPRLQAPLHSGPSAHCCSLPGSVPLVPRGGLHLPYEAPHLQPSGPTCLAAWSTVPGGPSQAARLADGSGATFYSATMCHPLSTPGPCPPPTPGPHSSAQASVPLAPIPERREGTSAVDWAITKGGAVARGGVGPQTHTRRWRHLACCIPGPGHGSAVPGPWAVTQSHRPPPRAVIRNKRQVHAALGPT